MKPLLLSAALCALIWPAWAVPVSISVVGPDDKPLPDARVEVRQGDGYARLGKFKLQELAAPIVANAGQWKLDWDGQFAEPTTTENLLGTKQFLWARISAPGMATQTRQLASAGTTIRLTPSRVWSGVVSDRDEKPIEGVRVQMKGWGFAQKSLESAPAGEEEAGSFTPVDPSWIIETVTDTQGRWQLDDLPQRGRISLGLSKPPYARANFNLELKDENAPPLFLSPGASVAGQIVAPDGKPVADQFVVAGWSGDGQTRTDAQGRFFIDGLSPGQTSLSPRDYFGREAESKSEFLLPQQDMIKLSAGETTDIGQWKAQLGTTIKMRVVDAATGKPVEGARFTGSDNSVESDTKGDIQARVARRESSSPFFGSVIAEGYKGSSVAQPVDLPEGGTVDVGVVKLERGSVISGTVRVEGEDNAPDLPTLSFQMGDANDSEYNNLDDRKTFKTSAMRPGNYDVYAYKSWGSEPSKDWEVVSPKRVTVPAPGVAFAPIEIVFKRLTPAKAVVKSARGRLVDAQGVGVAGAVVSTQFVKGYNSSGPTAITDSNGDWSVQSGVSATEFKFLGVNRPGYNQAGEAKIDIADGLAVVRGLTLKKRGATYAGRIVGADGKAASGAWIGVLEARYYAPVRADERGEFELPNLPLENFTLLAGKANDWARVETSADATNREFTLAAPAAFEREAAVNQALQGAAEWHQVEGYWDALGWERIEKLSESKGDAGDWDRAQFALQLAEREPTIFLVRAPKLLPKVSDGYKSEVELQWRLAQAASENADDKIEANNWVDEGKAAKKAINAASVTQLLRLAAVASKLGRADANDLNDYAAAIAAQIGGATDDDAETMGKTLGSSGHAATNSFADGLLKPIAEFNLWNGAIVPIAKSGDVAGTKAAIARMEKLAATPEWVALAAKQFWNNPVEKIRLARVEAARALADTDLPVALSLIESIDDSDYSKSRAVRTLADRAIKNGDRAVAENLLRGTMKSRISNPEGYALSASLSQQVSPQLGEELWAEALRRAVPSQPDARFGGDYVPSVAMWAFYRARLDAAQSRVLIEREWNWQLEAFAKATDDEKIRDKAFNIKTLVMAMGAIDPARALQMRAQAAKVNTLTGANVGLAATLLSSDAERARFGVDGRY